MLAKTNSKKKLILPKAVASAARAKLVKLELKEKDIAGAIRWARKRACNLKK